MSSDYVLAVSWHPEDATTTLFFEHLRRRSSRAVRIVSPRQPGLARLIAEAVAVVVVRALFECREVAWSARLAGVPCYYFIDDNFVILREQGGEPAKYVQAYSLPAVRNALRRFAGVLVATDPLLEYFRREAVHKRLFQFPPCAVPDAPFDRPASPSLRVAFFGGQHLRAKVLERLVPVVRQLALRTPTQLILMGVTAEVPDSPGVTVTRPPYEPSYSGGLNVLARTGVDVLVHPSADGMQNNSYKNPHALITAHALGAALVTSNAAPYAQLRDERVALLCEDDDESWLQALRSVSSDDQRHPWVSRIAAYCERHFDGRVNDAVIDEISDAGQSRKRAPLWMTQCGFAAAAAVHSAARTARRAWHSFRPA